MRFSADVAEKRLKKESTASDSAGGGFIPKKTNYVGSPLWGVGIAFPVGYAPFPPWCFCDMGIVFVACLCRLWTILGRDGEDERSRDDRAGRRHCCQQFTATEVPQRTEDAEYVIRQKAPHLHGTWVEENNFNTVTMQYYFCLQNKLFVYLNK